MADYTKLCEDLQRPIEKIGELVAENIMDEAADAIESLQDEIERIKDMLFDADGNNLVNYWCQQAYVAENGCRNFAEENARLKAENDDYFYKLTGVMHSVDKWLDGKELEQDEASRAVTMREKTLQIVEKLQAKLDAKDKRIADLEAENERLEASNRQFNHMIQSAKHDDEVELAENKHCVKCTGRGKRIADPDETREVESNG